MEFKVFNRKLSAVVKSQKTQRDNVQELITAGLVHYENESDTTYLTLLVNACLGVRSLPTKTITAYIQEHANVAWGKLKDGSKGYKKSGEKGCAVKVKMPEVTWYDWEGGEHNAVKSPFVVSSRMKSFVSAGVTAKSEGRCANEEWEKVQQIAEMFGIEIDIAEAV